jgi:hypothetical protein
MAPVRDRLVFCGNLQVFLYWQPGIAFQYAVPQANPKQKLKYG